jgi:hypothetical protein
MQVKFKFFQSRYSSWTTLFQDAVDFANQLSKDRLINISHSADRNEGVVTVWYWADDETAVAKAQR